MPIFRRSLLKIGLAVAALGLLPKASAAPYLVYSGTITYATVLDSTEGTALNAKIAANLAKYNALPITLRNKIRGYITDGGGTLSDTIYLITDETNVANYLVVIVDPTTSKVRYTAVSGASLTAAQMQENFISGFDYPKAGKNGGLGIFKFSFSHPAGHDPVTGQLASYVVHAVATGPINNTANLNIVPARTAERVRVVQAGVLKETLDLPAVPAVPSPAGANFIASMGGSVDAYYFDDTATSSVAGASTKGVLTLSLNPAFTALANDGGGYVVTALDSGYIPPITGSNVAAFKTFANNIIAVHPNPRP